MFMTPELLSSIAAALISLAASYLPGFAEWFAGLEARRKRLACAGYGTLFGLALTCDEAGLWTLARAFVAALAANQSAYLISRPARKEGHARETSPHAG